MEQESSPRPRLAWKESLRNLLPGRGGKLHGDENRYPWLPKQPDQEALIDKVLSDLQAVPNLDALLRESHFDLDRMDLIARYCDAAGWMERGGGSIAKTIEEVMRWRIEMRIPHLVNDESLIREFEDIAKRDHIYVCGWDRRGRPIMYVDFYRLCREHPDDALRYLIFNMERACCLMKVVGGEQRVMAIIDCSGRKPPMVPQMQGCSGLNAKEASTVVNLYYANRLGAAVVTGERGTGATSSIAHMFADSHAQDACFSISMLYKAVSWIVPEETRKKVTFVEGHERVRRHLLGEVEAKRLLRDYGGNISLALEPLPYLYSFNMRTGFPDSSKKMKKSISSGGDSLITSAQRDSQANSVRADLTLMRQASVARASQFTPLYEEDGPCLDEDAREAFYAILNGQPAKPHAGADGSIESNDGSLRDAGTSQFKGLSIFSDFHNLGMVKQEAEMGAVHKQESSAFCTPSCTRCSVS